MQPRIYLGQTPDTVRERVDLREQALALAQRVRQSHADGLCAALFGFTAGAQPPLARIDLLIVRAEAVIVGALRAYAGPIDTPPEGAWRERTSGQLIVEADGAHPLHRLRAQREAVQLSLNAAAERLGVAGHDPRPFKRVIGALICVPALHPESRISLDVDDHRDGLKVCGFDELAGVAAMAHSGVSLSDEAIHTIAAGLFGGRLWHDGARLLFDLAPPRLQLRIMLPAGGHTIVPLPEGGAIIGRRRSARRFERRVVISGDDLVSIDHLQLSYDDDPAIVTIRDMSKNGTWLTSPGGPVEHIRGETRTIAVGARLRLGMTEVLLEEARNE